MGIQKLILVWLIGLVLINLGMGGASARVPEVGDHVQILVGSGTTNILCKGYIEGFPDGFICLNCTNAKVADGTIIIDRPLNICIGTGQICLLQWLDRYGDPIFGP